MSWNVQIYVALPDERVPVWRPVNAERVGEALYLILEQPYDRESERWQFEPGDLVECEYLSLASGSSRTEPVLTAVRRAASGEDWS